MKKVDDSCDRHSIDNFEQIVNVGPAMADDFRRLGLHSPAELIGQDAMELYERICQIDGVRHDPCVIDVYMSTIDFMNGNPARKWWEFTAERKRLLAEQTTS